jgi:transcriptional regulator with XRE-family HTH domain
MTFDLKAERLNRGLSRYALAAAVDVPEPTIRRIENGHSAHPANAKKIADYFDIQVTDLLPIKETA